MSFFLRNSNSCCFIGKSKQDLEWDLHFQCAAEKSERTYYKTKAMKKTVAEQGSILRNSGVTGIALINTVL